MKNTFVSIRKTLIRAFICLVFFAVVGLSVNAETGEKHSDKGYEISLAEETAVFGSDDAPVLELKLRKERGIFATAGAFLKSLFVDEYKDLVISAEAVGDDKENVEVSTSYTKNGKFSVSAKPRGNSWKPGKHSVSIKVSGAAIEGGEASFVQDFSWGVLAFNPDKSVYRPGEESLLQFGVLDEKGHTICNARLEVDIVGPGRNRHLSTEDGSIVRNPECGPDNIILTPDYSAKHRFAKQGDYAIRIKAISNNGEWEISDAIEVRETIAFDVQRIGPTRINPKTAYGMRVIFKTDSDFNGSLVETVPAGFTISDLGLRIAGETRDPKADSRDIETKHEIVWQDISLKAGETAELSYSFDAPDVFPEFYLLGPLVSRADGSETLLESRSWQIASDGDNQIIVAQNIAIDSGTTDTVNWTEIVKATSTLFTGNSKYFVYVTAGFSGSAAGVNADFEIVYGDSTQYVGFIEASGDQANDAAQIAWFDVMDQVSTPSDIILRYRTNTGTSSALNAQIVAINLSNLETSDWKYAINTTSRGLTTTVTADASMTMDIADGVKDWLVFAMAEIDITSTARQYYSHIYDGTTASMQLTREGQDGNEFLPHVLYRPYDNLATNTVLSIRNSVSVAANTHLKSRVFALNLNRFDSFKTYYANINTALNGTWTAVGNLNSGGNYAPAKSGNQLIFASFINDITAAANESDDRLQVGGTTMPTSWSWGQSPAGYRTGYDNTEELVHNIFAVANMPTSGQTINLDAIEVPNATQVADEVSMTVFSANLKNLNHPYGEFSSSAFRNDGTGKVDISFAMSDRDLDDSRIKVEYEQGASCSFSSASKATISTLDADTTASYGDPQVDNVAAYQVGTSTGWITTSYGTTTVDFDWNSKSDIDGASSTYCLRLTANDGTNDQSPVATTTIYIDNFAPVITSLTIPNRMFKVGDTIRATATLITESGALSLGGGSTVNGVEVSNLQKVDNTTFTFDYVVSDGETDRATGSIPYSIALVDSYNNKSATSSGNFANGSLDANRPIIGSATIPEAMYGIEDSITVTVNVVGDTDIYKFGVTTINGVAPSYTRRINDSIYEFDYIIFQGHDDRAHGSIPYSIVLRDSYGNENIAYAGNFADGSIDAHWPEISSIYLTNDTYGIGDIVTAVVNADAAGLTAHSITINSKSLSGFVDNGDATYTLSYTVAQNDTDRATGTIPVSVVMQDAYGNRNIAYTAVAANTASIDAHRPVISAVTIPDLAYKIGDTIKATASLVADPAAYGLGPTTINGVTVSNLVRVNNTTYTFEITVASGQSDRAAGTIPISVVFSDQLGQENLLPFTAISANTASVDANKPVVSSVSFVPSSGVLSVGDTATATIFLAGAETGATLIAATINNVDVTESVAEIGAGYYSVSYVVEEGDTDRADNDDLPISIEFSDTAGNASDTYVSPDPSMRPGVDAHTPSIQSVTFSPVSGLLKVGDTATATIQAAGNETGLLAGNTMTINGINVISSFSELGGGQYRVTYTVSEGNTDIPDGNDLPISLSLKDNAGNNSAQFTTADSGNRPGVDANTPSIQSVSFSPVSGLLKVGDTATATIQAAGNETGLLAGNTMTINGINVISSFSELGGGQYRVTYTVAEGNTDILDANDLPISFSLKDAAGNNSVQFTTADSGNRPGVDANTPSIQSVTFSPTSGLLKVGDTATATIQAAGNETGLLAGNAMTINGINVISSFSELGGGQYRVTYTVAEGNTDILDANDLPISLSLKDNAGNNSAQFTTADSGNRPGVDANTPSIQSVSFSPVSGLLKVGDTATATIQAAGNETGLLAGNTMTINGINVISSFSELGGGQYRVTYTVSEGNTDILDANDLPISFSLKDAAGNNSVQFTTADSGNRPGVDANTPSIQSVSFSPTSGVLKVGDTATATIQAAGNETGLLAGNTMTINGVNVLSSFSELGGGQYRVTYTVSEGNTDILDANDLPISLSLKDNTGNNSAQFTTADSVNRPGVDANTPTTPGNLSYYSHGNNSITISFGAAVTEANFQEYKIFYKQGSSGASETDSVWDSGDDANLASRTFNGALTTTIGGLALGVEYVFNIWAYDTAGNKSHADWELAATTNHAPGTPASLLQKMNDNVSVVANGDWAINQTMILSSQVADVENDFIDYYFEVLPVAGTFTESASVPAQSCHSGNSFADCSAKIWRYSTGPAWYDEDWSKRKQITISADLVVDDLVGFPVLSSSIDEDLKREARSDGRDIIFTAADGVTPLNFERKLWDPASGQLISWIKTDLSSSTDNFIYMYYGNSAHATDLSTTTGVWDQSYLGVWHMDEAPSGSADDIKDSSGNSRHMTSYNMDSSKRIKTDTGYAYEFDGAGDYLEDADGENYINGLSAFTVELWLKSDVIASDRGFIIGSVPAGNDSYFTLRYDEAGANNGNIYHNLVKGAITITGPTEKQYESSQNVQTTDWQHLIFRWTSGGQYEVFVNGQYDSYTFNSPAGAGTTMGADRLRIGQGGKDTTASLGWDGLIDEVRISNVYRSDAFVQTAYNNQSNLNSFALFGAQEAVRIYNIPESSSGYKWQVMACDDHSACSDWVAYDPATPNFKVDSTAPTKPGNLTENSKTSTSVTLNFGATSTETYFTGYGIYYRVNDGTPVSTSDNLFSASDDANLGNILFNGKATTTIENLTAGTAYQFNIWAFDESGQSASATPVTITTDASSNPPTSVFNSVAQKTDGSGRIDISVEVDDPDNNDTLRLRLDYAVGASCDFSTPLDPSLSAADADTSADYGDPDIDNGQGFQIGSSSAYIMTSPGSNTVNFDWLSASDLPDANGVYCLRLSANDGAFDQSAPATTTVYIDNLEPTAPGNLSLLSRLTYGFILDYGTESLEDNFAEYRIYFRQGSSGVSESDQAHLDANLADRFYSGAATTSIGNLLPGTAYVFNIWAYDDYGNKASASEQSFVTNYIPTISSLNQRKNDALTDIAAGGWTTENQVRLGGSLSDGDTSEVLSIFVEIRPEAAAFLTATSMPADGCGPDETYENCISKVWRMDSASGNYSVTPWVTQIHAVALPDSASGYKWQVIACDDQAACSEWADFSGNPDFRIDTINPTTPGNLSFANRTFDSLRLSFGAQSTDANFREYIIYYQTGAGPVTEAGIAHASTSDANLVSASFAGATSTLINGLSEGTQYSINIWAYDQSGRKASATAISLTTNTRPSATFTAASQKTDGSGRVDISFLANDANSENSKARIDYVSGAACNFTSPFDLLLDEDDQTATSTYGDAKIENDNIYQIGNASGWIRTDSGANTVSFDWLGASDLPNADGTYCLRLTMSDGQDNQATSATTTLIIDNLRPTDPGALSLASTSASTISLNFGAASVENRFARYRMYYKEGASTVTEGDLQHTDASLSYIDYRGSSVTMIGGLKANTQYSFRLYAYDSYGNKASSSQSTFTTNAPPIGAINSIAQKTDGSGRIDLSIEVYDTNLDPCRAKLEYVAGAACDFSSPSDPSLDENVANYNADFGTPSLANASAYQIGESTRIVTNQGSNTINLDWLAANDIGNTAGVYCLRLTVNDGLNDQAIAATSSFYYDDQDPVAPGSLTVGTTTGISVALSFGNPGIDPNFAEYKIFYKEGIAGVTESDQLFNLMDDPALGAQDYQEQSFTVVDHLSQQTDYAFNIWIYDDYGNKAQATEVSTTTLAISSASWREAEDANDPAADNYLGKEENIRLRLDIANTRDYPVTATNFGLQYARKTAACSSLIDWTTVTATSTADHFVFVSSEFIDSAASSTSERLSNPDAHPFVPGYIVEAPAAATNDLSLGPDEHTEIEYIFSPTAASVSGATYCFRANQDGQALDRYIRYAEFTLAPPPTASFVSASQKADGSETVDIRFRVFDVNGGNARARLDYVAGSACDFAAPLDPSIDIMDENTIADYGDPEVDNEQPYQIGTSSGWIITDYGTTTIDTDWLMDTDLSGVNGTYCLRVTANDSFDDQLVPATTTIILDQVAPTAPGDLSQIRMSSNSVTLGLGSSSVDSNFKEYKIFYKEGASGVTESDSVWASSSDANLGFADFGGATSTKITGLTVNKQYVFRIWAYDRFGHSTPSSGEISVIIRYVSRSENWRFYSDQGSETPTSSLAAENIAPIDVPKGADVKLRLALREIESITGDDVKLRLQYSTFADFSSDVHFVGEPASSSEIWVYGNGVDNDNDPISEALLTGVSSGATHNESGISTTSYDHVGSSIAEWEFTIRANEPQIGTVYYFRAYDNTNHDHIIPRDAFEYPSLMIASPGLSYVVGGRGEGELVDGVMTTVAASNNMVDFGSVLPGSGQIAVHSFVVDTNAGGGYQLFVYQRQNLLSANGASIQSVPYGNDAPDAWPLGLIPSAFGYHAGDDTLSGLAPSRFAADNTYAGFSTDFHEISYSSVPVENESVDLVIRLETSELQAAGDYETELVYILLPTFVE